MLRPRQTGETVHSEDEWFVRRDGSMFPIAWWSAPIDTTGGRGAVLAFTDITERLASEKAYGSGTRPKSVPPALQVLLGELGINYINSRPCHPQTCGKVCAFHQTLKKRLTALPPAATVAELQD
jgi:hypothetical protein